MKYSFWWVKLLGSLNEFDSSGIMFVENDNNLLS